MVTFVPDAQIIIPKNNAQPCDQHRRSQARGRAHGRLEREKEPEVV